MIQLQQFQWILTYQDMIKTGNMRDGLYMRYTERKKIIWVSYRTTHTSVRQFIVLFLLFYACNCESWTKMKDIKLFFSGFMFSIEGYPSKNVMTKSSHTDKAFRGYNRTHTTLRCLSLKDNFFYSYMNDLTHMSHLFYSYY